MRLGEAVSIHKGKKPEAIVAEPEPGYRRLIQIDDLRPNATPKFCPPSRGEVLAELTDVIIAWDGANAATSGFGLTGVIGSTLAILRPQRDDVFTPYLGRFVHAQQPYLRQRCQGATVPHIDGRILEALEVRLPLLPEQRRIAKVLDRADALRAKRNTALAQLDTLGQSIFVDVFGDPATNPKGWPTRPLDALCRSITDIDHKMPIAVEEGVPFISAKDLLDDGGISFENVKRISEEDFRRLSRKSQPEKGDIIYSRIGVNLGKARMVLVGFEFLASYSCCTIKPNLNLIDATFLCSLLDSPFILRQAQKGVRAIAVPDLGLGEIKAFRIIVPPMNVQRDFARRLTAVQNLRASQRKSLGDCDALFASLQHRAFRGEL